MPVRTAPPSSGVPRGSSPSTGPTSPWRRSRATPASASRRSTGTSPAARRSSPRPTVRRSRRWARSTSTAAPRPTRWRGGSRGSWSTPGRSGPSGTWCTRCRRAPPAGARRRRRRAGADPRHGGARRQPARRPRRAGRPRPARRALDPARRPAVARTCRTARGLRRRGARGTDDALTRHEPPPTRRWTGARATDAAQATAGSIATGSRWASWWFALRGVARTARVRSSSFGLGEHPLPASTVSSAVEPVLVVAPGLVALVGALPPTAGSTRSARAGTRTTRTARRGTPRRRARRPAAPTARGTTRLGVAARAARRRAPRPAGGRRRARSVAGRMPGLTAAVPDADHRVAGDQGRELLLVSPRCPRGAAGAPSSAARSWSPRPGPRRCRATS